MKKKFLTILLSVFLLTGWTTGISAELKKELFSPEEWERLKKSGIVSEEKPKEREEVIRTNSTREYDFSMQEAMADEALKHLGAHFQYNRCGGIGKTTPEVWYGNECNTWRKWHKKRNICCIGVRHFDCSGFVYFCANQVGFNIPRHEKGGYGSPQLWHERYVAPIALDKIRKGTLLFGGHGNVITHVGIYLGDGNFVDAAWPGVDVRSWELYSGQAKEKRHSLFAGNINSEKVEKWRKIYEELRNAKKKTAK
ncbi:MAG: hypothetical protein CO162_08005 [bacterium (Candidatus Ratteibacteria) CG_4_9_14_3_um_filter_41_21]|uniref:NlpC/P60 domain-containing protein n=2 Tax=Candidatus Ratteibacteria TaxID=2979319 RepID=A0A2M7YDP9_9BACT|nr:MAG: hypothetical protein COS11_04885 [bacterium (Candidatus Ratteibacteria) CG01_land_8_20_14_3_00_40_19]PJA61114.1 MAG: hypothetical protein CO162_08005 [bacterium (Candidatus Ratteibacteria) CG_4_9_14_3_um_filter_41_21]